MFTVIAIDPLKIPQEEKEYISFFEENYLNNYSFRGRQLSLWENVRNDFFYDENYSKFITYLLNNKNKINWKKLKVPKELQSQVLEDKTLDFMVSQPEKNIAWKRVVPSYSKKW